MAAVNKCCESYLDDGQDYWQGVWDDCSTSERVLLAEIANSGDVVDDADNRRRASGLTLKGILITESQRLKFSSQMMSMFAKQAGASSGALRRLFGTHEDFRRNAKPLAQARLALLPPADQILFDYAKNAIANLDKPILWSA
jgi:hypothetical protein